MRKSKKTALLRLTTIATALKSILSVAALVPITAMGLTLDVQNNKAVTDGEGGDALLFPFYTTGNGDNAAITSFSLTNQSATDTIAIKIRFREQKFGLDALDFLVVMSPNDKFDFWVYPGDNGRPVMGWDDSTCVVGPQPGYTSVEFPDPANWDNSFGITNADLAAGTFEVFGLAALNKACVTTAGAPTMWNGTVCPTGSISLAAAARHNAQGIPANCQVLMDFLNNPYSVRVANENSDGNGIADWTAPTFLPVQNSLAGRYVITIPGSGIEGEGDPVTIQNANITHGSMNPAKYGGNFVGLVTAQSPAYCSDVGNCMSKYAWDKQEYSHPHIGELANLANLQRLMSTSSIAADWSYNPLNGINVDWVISFPIKYAYSNFVAGAWHLLPNTKTGLGLAGAWVASDSTNLGISLVNPRFYDIDEQVVTGGSSISVFANVNVLTITGAIATDSLIQTEAKRTKVIINNGIRGWANLPLSWRGTGDAVMGLTFTTRNITDPVGNVGLLGTLRTRPLIRTTDFVVTAIALNPAAPTANSNFTATVTVKNQGTLAGDGKFLDVWSQQPTAQICGAVGNKRQAVGVLAAGATKTLTFTGITAGGAGAKTFRAFVDSGCGTAEGNEANNQFVKSYNVQ